MGDDLNGWLWVRLVGERFVETGGDVLLVGIGTILDHHIPCAEKTVIFGSGVGYHAVPESIDPSWDVVCVRGPLTAAALNLPADKAVTDGAILIAALPEYAPVPKEQRRGIVFMPHVESAGIGAWQDVCRRTGIECVDPRQDSRQIIDRIRHAELVLAEAMHAAVVADAVRVPWIPVVTSSHINSFKWRDWARSLNLVYHPMRLPSVRFRDYVREKLLALFAMRYDAPADCSDEALLLAFQDICRNKTGRQWRQKLGGKILSMWASLCEGMEKLPMVSVWIKRRDNTRRHRTADALRAAAASQSYLSADGVHQDRLREMQHRLQTIVDKYSP